MRVRDNLLIASVVLLVLFIRGIYNDIRYKVNFDAGEYVEYEVNKWLQKLCKHNKDFYFLNSIIIPNKKTKTTEIDHILFTPFVVLVMETKHWSGTIKGCESDEYWIQELGYNIIHKKINAYKQNQTHINSLKELLHTNIDGCIIFDNNADIEWLDVKNILFILKLYYLIKKNMKNEFDVIVIGGGHAGLEAAFASSSLGKKTALITLNQEHIGDTPCNPSVGGPAKGIVTREIDALGGMQGIAADNAQLQMKLLNSAKGAGVWALRAQIDKVKYHDFWINAIENQKNLTLIIDEAKELIVDNNTIKGIKCHHGTYKCKALILTTGTYLKPICHRGNEQHNEGPSGQQGANYLSNSLLENNIGLIRLKTGTPPRILKSSIDFTKMQIEPGTNDMLSFEHFNPTFLPFDMQTVCHLTYTNQKTHKIIKDNISKSAMYSGRIHSIGPRYCPSIEDKIMRFADKDRHQIFIEPESASWDSMYLQGLSTSFDRLTQEKIVHSIVGLEKAVFLKYAYAIEYDAIDPTQLKLNYELKTIKNLFCAGQINGTSGYEEAAGQGLLAGINAVLNIKKKQPLILKRSEAYLGVLTDDIMTKGITEPYRLLTSRAEHRLYLRNDNAQERLIEYGKKIGLVKKEVYLAYKKNSQLFDNQIKFLKNHKVHQYKKLLKQYKCGDYTLYKLIKRPEVKTLDILLTCRIKNINPDICKKIDINIKFEGYIANQLKSIRKLSNLAKCSLLSIKNYKQVPNLTLEAIDKLNKIMPTDLEQASRISGINLVDIAIIKNYITKGNKNHG